MLTATRTDITQLQSGFRVNTQLLEASEYSMLPDPVALPTSKVREPVQLQQLPFDLTVR